MGKFEQPDYNRIYNDIVEKKFPQRKEEILPLLQNHLTALDVIRINKIIFGKGDDQINMLNQQHKSYDRETILKILDYQKKNHYNNITLAKHFNLSRNTIAKWRKIFIH
ncbi:helix-turn-helix domain-containing protein [Chryseobacterium sp.]|uniref:helix-turn-helix domain-containing protein n=1 Tax=Chryseobacterium sp. TaxID=1871047 RepID=UPI0035C70793